MPDSSGISDLECTTTGFAPFNSPTLQHRAIEKAQTIPRHVATSDAIFVDEMHHSSGCSPVGMDVWPAHNNIPCEKGVVLGGRNKDTVSKQIGGEGCHFLQSTQPMHEVMPSYSSPESPQLIPEYGSPVLLGYDVVEYWKLKPTDEGVPGMQTQVCHLATYDKSQPENAPKLIGVYEFWFANEDNMAAFGADPWKYAPKWGGFCSWGISHEIPPVWPWAADFLGPPAHPWDAWTLYNGSLYFNYFPSISKDFFAHPTENIKMAESRWEGWFGELQAGPFNTVCMSGACCYDPEPIPAPCPPDGQCEGDIPEVRCFVRNGGLAVPNVNGTSLTHRNEQAATENISIDDWVVAEAA